MKKIVNVKKYWIWIHAGFITAFLIQSFCIVYNLLNPSQTTTNREEKEMEQLPILFKICVKPGFDSDTAKAVGYSSIYKYFLGESMYDNRVYGWKGHYNETKTNNNSVQGINKFHSLFYYIFAYRCLQPT